MSKKGIIIGIFIRKSKILSFLEELRNKFYVKTDKVFVYNIESNENEYLVTFKTFNKDIFIKNLQIGGMFVNGRTYGKNQRNVDTK